MKKSIASGIKILKSNILTYNFEDYKLIMVTESSEKKIKEYYSYLSILELFDCSKELFGAAFTAEGLLKSDFVFVITNSEFAIGFVVLRKAQINFKMKVSPPFICSIDNELKVWIISRIWLCGDYRGKGIAKKAIFKTCTILKITITDLGIEIPVTNKGIPLFLSIFPDYWYLSGDGISLEETKSKLREQFEGYV